jgi:crotonobetainyl-CoA:carnitine CoA-transferase CaiB-like acyl-CoA transferase
MEIPSATGPLADLRVLDLTRALSGPFATMILGDLGADVIKVEDIWHGDDTRRWGPPFQGDDAAYFLSINRNKRGLSVNMKTPEGQQLVQRLAESSDILMENFRPRDTLIPRITRALATRGCAEWTDRLNAAGVPAGPVNTVPAALEQAQITARQMVVEVEHPVAGMLRMLGTPLKLSAQPASIRRPPPVLGQHTDEILAEAGYPAARIAELREAGVIRLPLQQATQR